MNKINPRAGNQRTFLRVLGPIVLLVGLFLTIAGVGSFFSSFGSFERPDNFHLAFIGMPLIAVGGVLCKFGYMGAVARYAAGELAPVGKDTFNYLASGTKEGVRDMVSAVREGITGEEPSPAPAASGTIRERLQKLEALHNDGLIDDDDYEEQKDRILKEI